MGIRQISIFVENSPGSLRGITSVLKNADIDIRALSLADTTDFGILRIIVDDPDKTLKILRDNKITASITPVLAVKMNDKPGGLHDILEVLNIAGIDVEYAYAFLGRQQENAYVILKVEDSDAAEKILLQNGITPDLSEVLK